MASVQRFHVESAPDCAEVGDQVGAGAAVDAIVANAQATETEAGHIELVLGGLERNDTVGVTGSSVMLPVVQGTVPEDRVRLRKVVAAATPEQPIKSAAP